MEIIFLGTSCMVPTKERNLVSALVKLRNYDLLIDCGEGTQRQIKILGEKPNRIRKILITHWHGDHVLGLPGLIQTMAAFGYQGKLEIYGPKGSKKYFKHMMQCSEFYLNLDIKLIECRKGKIFEDGEYIIECAEMEHSVPCINYSIMEQDKYHIKMSAVKKLGIPEGPMLNKLSLGKDIVHNGKKIKTEEVTSLTKGKKLVFITDTELCEKCFKLAQDADTLVCEATFMSDLEERTETVKHMTTHQAAAIANKSNVKQLILTHFSQRYRSTSDIENNAREVFANTRAAHDFMKVKV